MNLREVFLEVIKSYGINLNASKNARGWIKNLECPLPWHKDKRPSASFNLDENHFHCFTCGIYCKTIEDFVSKMENISKGQALAKINNLYKNRGFVLEAPNEVSPRIKERIEKTFFLKWDQLEELGAYISGNFLKLNIIINRNIYDVKFLDLTKPGAKFFSSKGGLSGLIYPYNQWKASNKKWTFIMAGEKDMFLARRLGLNAITITGGELTKPTIFGPEFKGKNVCIVYDNDNTGKKGGRDLASWLLLQGAAKVKNITKHHLICKEPGEDFYDYFIKYGKKVAEFRQIIIDTPLFILKSNLPFKAPEMPLNKALTEGHHNRWFLGSGFISAKQEIKKIVWTAFKITHKKSGETFTKNFQDPRHMPQALLYCGTPEEIKKTALEYYYKEEFLNGTKTNKNGGALKPEPYHWNIEKIESKTLWEVYINTSNEINEEEEILAITYDNNFVPGGKYKFLYQFITRPKSLKKELVMLIPQLEKDYDFITEFVLNDKTKRTLNKFKQFSQGKSIEKAWDDLYKNFTYIGGGEIDYDIFSIYEMTYHSALELPYDEIRKEQHRGVIHSLIIGESGIGKSKTGKKMKEIYGAGAKVDLQNTTAKALIGGSKKSDGAFRTVVGFLPIHHKGLVVLEELQRSDPQFHRQIAEMRSSGYVEINRVSNNIKAPCVVRQVEVANQVQNAPISSFSSGVAIISSLIHNFQDVRRYEVFLIKGEKPIEEIGHFQNLAGRQSHFFNSEFQTRLAWAWTRKGSDIIFTQEATKTIEEKSVYLQKKYDIRFKLFSKETDIKIKRLAVAVAIALVSADETLEKVLVKQEHIEFVVNFLERIYNTKIFKLEQYANEEKEYNTEQVGDSQNLFFVFNEISPELILRLYENIENKIINLKQTCNIDNKNFKKAVEVLGNRKLIRIERDVLIGSPKLKAIYNRDKPRFKEAFEAILKARMEKLEILQGDIGEIL